MLWRAAKGLLHDNVQQQLPFPISGPQQPNWAPIYLSRFCKAHVTLMSVQVVLDKKQRSMPFFFQSGNDEAASSKHASLPSLLTDLLQYLDKVSIK